jgi:Glycerophosphoryl diester phosphodiesterase family
MSDLVNQPRSGPPVSARPTGGDAGRGKKGARWNDASAIRDRGADTLELDVNLTEDGQLVVIHDDTVNRSAESAAKKKRHKCKKRHKKHKRR